MSLDGSFRSRRGPGNGLGDRGARLHEWALTGADTGEMEVVPAGVDREVFDEMMSTGAVVAGRGTFELADGSGGDDHDGVPIFIVARHAPGINISQWPLVSYVNDVASAMAQAREAADDKDVLVHGAGTARLAIGARALDELELHVVPVLLGTGRRLFDGLLRRDRAGTDPDPPGRGRCHPHALSPPAVRSPSPCNDYHSKRGEIAVAVGVERSEWSGVSHWDVPQFVLEAASPGLRRRGRRLRREEQLDDLLPFAANDTNRLLRRGPHVRALEEKCRALCERAPVPIGLEGVVGPSTAALILGPGPACGRSLFLWRGGRRRGVAGAAVGASARVVSHCSISARSGAVSGVSSTASLLLSVAATVAIVGASASRARALVGRPVGGDGDRSDNRLAELRCECRVAEQVRLRDRGKRGAGGGGHDHARGGLD